MTTPESEVPREIMVRVWGMDADGHAFFQNVMASHLTFAGAQLTGMEHPLKAGEVIGLQYDGKKTRVRVGQVGEASLPGKMQAQIEIVGGQPCPWEDSLRLAADAKPQKEERAAASERNKRRFPRVRARFPLELRDERGGGTALKTHAADISGRGCYVETLVPLPLGTPLALVFWIDSDKIVTTGIVRSSDPGVGMGIEFTGLHEQTKERLQDHLEKLANA